MDNAVLNSGVKAIVFDAFGTVVQIEQTRHPFRKLLKIGANQGRSVLSGDTRSIMANAFAIGEAAAHLGIDLTAPQLVLLQADLKTELDSIRCFSDAINCISKLKSAGIKVAICSNLALPYGASVESAFPHLDAYAFSFAVGVLKPDARMYQNLLDQLGVDASDAWMIGDSQRCDRDGPNAFGIKGHYLARSGIAGNGDFADLNAFAATLLND